MVVEGGFGTPVFPADGDESGPQRCVCVIGDQICVGTGAAGASSCDDCETTGEKITTLRAAAAFVGIDEPGTVAMEHDSPELGDIDRMLNISAQVGETLGWWFGLGAEVLAELVAQPGAVNAENVVLWPGHLDIATDIGDPAAGRASYGLSPGDHSHDEPYVYVGAWNEVDRTESFWNDEHFAGASLAYQDLLGVADPKAMVMEFLLAGYNKLNN